mgnify:CR=1 FL=1
MSNPIFEPTVLGSEQVEKLDEIVMDCEKPGNGETDGADRLSKVSNSSSTGSTVTPRDIMTPPDTAPSPPQRWWVSDEGAEDPEAWQRTLKYTMQCIKDMESTPLTILEVCKYEVNVLIATFVPMVLSMSVLLVLLYPLYLYAQEAIPQLIEQDFVPDAEQLKKLRLCPPNAGDDCVDPRFVMMYGVQEQFGQIYEGYLPPIPMYMTLVIFWVPFVFFLLVVVFAVVSASKQAVVEGQKQPYLDYKEGWKQVGLLNVASMLPFSLAQAAKATGMVSSIVGSGVSFVSVCGTFWLTMRKFRKIDADLRLPEGYMCGTLMASTIMIVINQFFVKRVTSQNGLCILWLVWTVLGEMLLSYWRLKLRHVDLSKVDTRIVPILSLCISVQVNCGKRIPLLCLTDYSYIIVMNIVCFVYEVSTRVTVVRRDFWIDRHILRKSIEECQAWKDALHRQFYLHNEMVQEMLELLFPLPITVTLFMIQYSPEAKVVLLAPILTNCAIQIVQELLADCACIMVGSRMQNKFYRVAKANLFSRQSYALLVFFLTFIIFAVNGLYFLTYMRVGLTADGHYLTVI